MNKRYARRKSGRKKRLLAAALVLCLLFTTYPDILKISSVFAAGPQNGNDTVYVSGFASLPEEVREQTVLVGTGTEELTLPDTLEAFVAIAEEENAPGDKADAPKEYAPEQSASEETLKEQTIEETTLQETTGTDAADSNTDEVPAVSTDDTTTESNTYAAPQNDQPEQTNLPEQSEQIEQVTIEGITWESYPSYDAQTEGVYVFTPVLPEGYALSEGVSLPGITVTVMGDSKQAEELNALLAQLRALPDPERYLTYDEAADVITEHEEMIDEEQLAKAREAAGAYLEVYPDTDQNVTSDADTVSGTATLATLLTRLEALEHIRDTETDCMEADCPYHYPRFVKARMNEDEIPELLTMEDLVEDYGIEEPESVSVQSIALLSEAGYAGAPRTVTPSLHPQTLMLTDDNENNAHTGASDGDIDYYMSQYDSVHPIELTFTLNELPAQSAYLAVKAYDVDEDISEHDYVYLNDDIYQPMDKTDDKGKTYNSGTIGYLAGTTGTWNTTILEIPLEKLVKGKNVISVTVAAGWCVEIDWMQLILDGGAVDANIEEFSLKLKDSAADAGNVKVSADVTIRQSGSTEYITEYTLTQDATGNALDACFGKAQAFEQVSLTLPLDSPSGIYTITGLIKDPDETIKAVDKLSFWFIQGVGTGPQVSHTLTPDTLTNQNVTIRVSVKDVPELGITGAAVSSPTKTVSVNGTYPFTVTYKQDNAKKTLTYPVRVDNIDKTAPVITYTPITVPEEMPQAEVEAHFKEALYAEDDRKLADIPLKWTLPANISYLSGTKNVTVTAVDSVGNKATENCPVTVTAKPLSLKMETPAEVSGSKDSFALKAVLTHTGADTITKTGFVWGVMPNPTLEVKNGSAATSSPVKTKGAVLSATATGIASGVQYYARAYATLQNGSTVYSDSVPFGSGLPNYGTFSVSKVSGSTFTISRTSGSDGKQTVYYRTVNGSAIGGTHFTHAAGGLVFADGEKTKTVTVSEKGVATAYSGSTATSYSNADRTYSLEIYRVEGGGKLDDNKDNLSKTRTMTTNGSYTIRRDIYTTDESVVNVAQASGTNGRKIADTTSKQGGKTTNVSFLTNRDNKTNYHTSTDIADYYTAKEITYLRNTAAGWYYRYDLLVYEYEDGYEHAYIGTQPLSDKNYTISSASAAVSGQTGQLWACNFLQGEKDTAKNYYFPDSSTGGDENAGYPLNSSGNCYKYGGNTYVKLGLDDTCYAYFGATGKDKDIWYVDGLTSYARVYDTQEPKCIGVAPMSGGDYLPGNEITVALVFNEIVDSTNSTHIGNVSINTNVGTLDYAGGVNTNVLYFTGTVESSKSLSGSSALKVTGINNSQYIKDMCDGGSAASFSTRSTNVTVDASTPSVTITANTSGSLPQHKVTIKSSENSVQYAWTKEDEMPAAGWQTLSGTTSGKTLTETRGTAGQSETWYLHVLATASSGASTHKSMAFTFMQPDITAVSVRAGETTSSADASDVWKTGKYIVAQYAGVQTSGTKITLSGPQTGTKTITVQTGTAAFKVTANGAYTVTLTDGYGSVVTKPVEVKNIDTEKPTASLQSGSQTGNKVTHNSVTAVITPADKGGSGVTKVEYAWTGSASVPASGWMVLNKAADGRYQAAYAATETTRTAKYLHVQVTDGAGNVSQIQHSGPYYVIKEAVGNALPTITVNGNSTTWTKSKTLTWTAAPGAGTGAGTIESVTIPTENQPVTGKTSGSCTVTKNGNYLFAVTDSNGNTVSQQITVTTIDNEAPELTEVTAKGGKTARITLTGVTDDLTSVLDEKGNFTGMGGSGVKTREYRLESENTWTTFTGDSFEPGKNGTYKIRLKDAAGNVSKTYSVTLSDLDKTAPSVTCKINATKNASGWYTVYPLPVELTYSDPTGTEGGASGIASVQYKWVTGSEITPTTGLCSINAAAVAGTKYTLNLGYYDNAQAYYLYYKVTDKMGNVTEGFSDVIKKDSYKGNASVSGPATGQPVTDGLLMKLNSLTYGPSGGKVTYGTWAETGTAAATNFPITGHAIGQKTRTDTQGFLGYHAKTPGSNYFRFYPTARGGGSYYWAFYVRKVTFDSQGGTAVPAQLVWHDSTNAVKCTVTKPADPTRTGYTFGGWYTDAACTEGNEFDFENTQLRANTTLYAKWTANKYKVTWNYTYPDGKGGNSETGVSDSYFYGEGYTLPKVPAFAKDWMEKGFAFDGWYTNEDCTGPKYTAVGKTAIGDMTYYGRCIDVKAPTFTGSSVNLNNDTMGKDGWRGNSASSYPAHFAIIFNDNNGGDNVTGYIIVDGKEATTDGVKRNGTAWWYYLLEGEHTYQWKMVDKAGNVALGEECTYKFDGTLPTAGTITHNAAGMVDDSNNVTWLCGKDEVVFSVPVKDELSGLNYVQYHYREPDGSKADWVTQSLNGIKDTTAELKFTNSGNGYKKKIGWVRCGDMARNISDSALIEYPDNTIHYTNQEYMGVIVENTAPDIRLVPANVSGSLEGVWHDSDPGVKVWVNDTGKTYNEVGTAISSGIKNITYSINGVEQSQVMNATSLMPTYGPFVIPGSMTGVVNITVEVEDHAGNTSSKSVVVKIKGTEMTPNATPDYPNDALSGLAPGANYKITIDGNDIVYQKFADENGRIPFALSGNEGKASDMCGKTVQIIKLGTTENGEECTTDSAAQRLTIAARPNAIAEGQIGTQVELAPDAENAKIDLNIEGVTGTKEYSGDGGKTWTDVPSDNKIENLKKGDVIVRMKATNSAPHSLKTTKNIAASTGTITAVYELNYSGAADTILPVPSLMGDDNLTKPKDPSRTGYQFMGWYMESGCENEWRFTDADGAEAYKVRDWRNSKDSTTFDPDKDNNNVYRITLYAKWRENVKPTLTPKLTTMDTGGTVTEVTTDGENWYPNLALTADYSDNVGVTKLSVSVDSGTYKELDISSVPSVGGTPEVYQYTYPVLEGEHTYQFKAEDAAGNVTDSAAVTARLDTVNPKLGEADVSNGYHSFWDWIAKNESLQIKVPVADQSTGSGIKASGIESVKYVLTPEGGSAQEAKNAEVSGGKAVIQIDPDFKGTVQITAYDNAGHTAEKTIGADGIKGVIVEDNAPKVTILGDREAGDSSSTKGEDAGIAISEEHYYNSAPRLYVKVTDDGAITSGLKTVIWSVDRIDNGAEHQSGMNFKTDEIKTEHSFTISALEGMDETVSVTVKAVDQAGNTTSVTQTVYIKTREPQPAPQIDYRKEILTNLEPNAKYKVLGTDGSEKEITADENGNIKMEEDWFGREVQICKVGDGTTTLDSTKTDVKPAARPAPPKTEAKKSETVKAKADGIIAASDASGLDLTTLEYSTDGGENWNPVTAEMLTDGKLTGCAAGAWLFRVPACDTAPYGETTEVVIGTGKTLTVSFEENGGSEVSEITNLSWNDTVKKPKNPVREGYELVGWYREADFQNIWHFEGEDPATVMEGDITLYAKWRDNVNPALSAVLISPRSNGNANEKQWYNNLSITLTYSDNTTVTEFYVSVDGGNDTVLNISEAAAAGKTPDGNVLYRLDDNNLAEGEHTYIFKAVDEGGNVTKTKALTARLDTTNPVAGEATYEEGYKNLLDWIIKKDNLLITVPVTDMGSDGKVGSGVESVAYTLTPVGADGNGDESKAIDGNAKIDKVSDGKFTAEIAVPADFKGTVKVTAADEAGNIAAEKTLGVDGNGKNGVIVEDNAPKVSFMTGGLAVTGDFYENAQDIEVTVDDTGDGITGGIASVQYEMRDEDGATTSYKVEHDYTTSLAGSDSFTVSADVFRPGVNTLTVTAADHAGNSVSVPVTVKIKRPEPTPNPQIDYVAERLTGLVRNAEYKIADVGMKADENGCVAIDESWIGRTVSVIRMPSTGENTVSAAKELAVPDRPQAPDVGITNETYPDAGDGILTMTETDKVYQFSTDGLTWTDAQTDENRQIMGLKAKDYYVRARAIENTSFRSKEGTVTVGTTPPTPYDQLNVTIDYENEKLTLVPEAEYIIEYGGSEGDPDTGDEGEDGVFLILKADENGKIPVEEEWLGETLSIVRLGNGKDKTDSPQQLLGIPVRPDAPNPSGEDETGIKANAKLTNLTANTAYDISTDGGKSWIRKTADESGVISGVDAPATYIVRLAAVGGFISPASDPVTVDGYHIPVTFVANGVKAGTSWAYYGKAPQNIPAVPKKADAGGGTFVGQWCANEEGKPADLKNITAETTFYAYYTVGYNIILKGGTGYTLAAATGSASPVKEGADFTLQFTLNNGYEKTDSFAVKVNGVKIALEADGTYMIENIEQDQTVTVEGIAAVRYPSGSSDDPDDNPGDNTGGDNNPAAEDNSPADGTPTAENNQPADTTKPDGTTPDGTTPDGTTPDGTKADGKKPGETTTDDRKPGETDADQTKPGGKFPYIEVPEGKTPGGSDFPNGVKLPDGTKLTTVAVPVTIDDGRIVITSGTAEVATGSVDGMESAGATLQMGSGEVIVTVICEDKEYTAGVRDTIAVANAVLSQEQMQHIINGGTIEILIDVRNITDSIQPQDKEIIEAGIEAGRKDHPELTLGMYIDISMFIKIGKDDWNAVTETEEPVDVVIGIPETLKADGREFTIIRSHDSTYALLPDMDDAPDTITVSTNLFSAYAIAYEEADKTEVQTPEESSTKCGLCHICPTFLGICYFIWLAISLAIVLIILIVILRKRKQEKQ